MSVTCCEYEQSGCTCRTTTRVQTIIRWPRGIPYSTGKHVSQWDTALYVSPEETSLAKANNVFLITTSCPHNKFVEVIRCGVPQIIEITQVPKTERLHDWKCYWKAEQNRLSSHIKPSIHNEFCVEIKQEYLQQNWNSCFSRHVTTSDASAPSQLINKHSKKPRKVKYFPCGKYTVIAINHSEPKSIIRNTSAKFSDSLDGPASPVSEASP
jgi:hypothetical protein